jgi:hypothetical protein
MQKEMQHYGRTNFNETWATKSGLTPWVWTKDESKGFKSFMECYQHWEDKAEADPQIKLTEVFTLPKQMFGIRPDAGKAYRGQDKEERLESDTSLTYYMTHMNEIDTF